jgi:hypothetical protein
MAKFQHNSDYLMGSFNRLSRLVKYSLFHKLKDIIEAIRPQLPCIIVYVYLNSENICDASRDSECGVAMAYRRGKSLSKLPKFYEYKGCVEKDGDRGRYRAECTQQTHTQNEKSHQRRHSFFVYGCVCTAAADRIHRVGEKKKEKKKETVQSESQ